MSVYRSSTDEVPSTGTSEFPDEISAEESEIDELLEEISLPLHEAKLSTNKIAKKRATILFNAMHLPKIPYLSIILAHFFYFGNINCLFTSIISDTYTPFSVKNLLIKSDCDIINAIKIKGDYYDL